MLVERMCGWRVSDERLHAAVGQRETDKSRNIKPYLYFDGRKKSRATSAEHELNI